MYYNLFIFILIFIILYLFNKFINKNEHFTKCNYDHLILKKSDLNKLKELLLAFINFANENNIKYFLIGGSLIGCLRNGGLLPHDDDIDIGILNFDEKKILQYNNDKYYFKKTIFGYKFISYNNNDKKMFIDIMIFKFKNNKYSIINYQCINEYFYDNELFPLKYSTFSNIPITIPNNPEVYLERAYPSWKNKIRFHCEHLDIFNNIYNYLFNNCFYHKLNLDKEVDVNYKNNKFLCYTEL